MSDNNLVTKSNGETIIVTDVNQYKEALGGDIVPRNTSGVPTARGGDIGTTTYPFENLNADIINRTGAVKTTGTVDLDVGESFYRDRSITVESGVVYRLEDTITFTTSEPVQVLFYVSTMGTYSAALTLGEMRFFGRLDNISTINIEPGQIEVSTTKLGASRSAVWSFGAGTHSIYIWVSGIGPGTIPSAQYGLRRF